jgi:hypothetical protein
MELMLLHLFHVYRLKGAEADVQGDLGGPNPVLAKLSENLIRKVQARRRSGYGSSLPCIHGLVPCSVSSAVFARNVGRQRHVPNPLQRAEEVWSRGKANAPLPELPTRQDLGLQFVLGTEEKSLAHANFPSRTYQAEPFVGICRDLLGQQSFDLALQKIPGSRVVRADGLSLQPTAPA